MNIPWEFHRKKPQFHPRAEYIPFAASLLYAPLPAEIPLERENLSCLFFHSFYLCYKAQVGPPLWLRFREGALQILKAIWLLFHY